MSSVARTAVVAIWILSLASAARAQFTPPANGKLTEKQVVNYIAVLKDMTDVFRAAGTAGQQTTSSAAGMAMNADAGKKMEASFTAHGISKEEFSWVDNQIAAVWPIASARQQLEIQIKAKQDDLKAANARLAIYQQAQKDGTRVLNEAQHDAATQAAGGSLDSAKQTVIDAAANVKQISDEVAAHDKDVADDEAQAKNPPANLADEDRSNYIDGRKNYAQAARDAATDARSRLKDAQKSLDDAKAELAAVQSKIDHPNEPITDDEKAAVKKEYDRGIADATATIDLDQKAIQSLKDTEPAGTVDPDNLALVQKHIGDYLAAMVASKPLDTK